MKARLFVAGALVLVLGLCSAVLIYFNATDEQETGEIYLDKPQPQHTKPHSAPDICPER